MNCLEFRRIRLSEPSITNPSLSVHRQECEACSGFESEIRQLDEDIYQVLNVDAPDGLAARILLNQNLLAEPSKPMRWSWLSLAASFLLAGIFSFYQISVPASIDKALVEHIADEEAMIASRLNLIEDAQIKQVLNSINLDSSNSITDVKFAANCIVNGQLVGHFKLERDQVTYTFFVLPGDIQTELRELELEYRHGVLLPQSNGSSIAVITDQNTPSVNRETILSVATEISAAIKPLMPFAG